MATTPKVLGSRAVGQVAAAVGAATILWLGYSIGRVQSIREVSQLYRDADTDRYSFSRSGVLVQFERLGGAAKPQITTSRGVKVLDISDWDPDSRITVDGQAYELVRLYPQSAVDYERLRVAETLYGDGWMLEREITLDDAGGIHIEHMFVARRRVERVDLALAHVAKQFRDPSIAGATFSASTSDSGSPAVGVRITSESRAEMEVARVRTGAAGPLGLTSVVVEFGASHPAQDQRVTLGVEDLQLTFSQ